MWPLVISGASALLFALLGVLLGRRHVGADMQPAWNLFRAWWFAVAALSVARPLRVGLFLMDWLPVWLYQLLRQVEFIVLCGGLWALLCYLRYAYRGTRRGWGVMGGCYALLALVLLALLARAGQPDRLVGNAMDVVAEPGLQLSTGLTFVLLGALVGPQIVAAVAYARLFFVVHNPTQRFRVAVVSMALIWWFGVSLAGAAASAQGPQWQTARATVGLVAALLVMVAYFPPAMVQRKFRIHPLSSHSADGPPVHAPAVPRRGV